jgi:hypothetical protein
MKPSTVNREAHALMALPKITTRVGRLQRQKERAIVAASLSDRERVLSKLRDLMDTEEGGSAINAQLRAAELLGKSVGLFKEVQMKEKEPRTVEELQAELDAFLEKHLGIKRADDELGPKEDPESPVH